MKKSIFYAILMLASISCMEIGMQQDMGEEITFRSSITTNTKAVSAVSFDAGFNVLAQFNSDKSLFFNETVSKKDDQYRTASPHYWVHGRSLDFYGVYPKTYGMVVNNGNVTVNYDGSTSADLIVAENLNVPQQSGTVDLTFQHVLGQLSFNVKATNTDCYYDVSSVTASVKKGTYNFSDSSWSNLSVLSAYKVNGDTVRATADGVSMGDAFTLVPGTSDIIITWAMKDKTSGFVYETVSDTVNVNVIKGKMAFYNLVLPEGTAVFAGVTDIVLTNYVAEEKKRDVVPAVPSDADDITLTDYTHEEKNLSSTTAK